MTREERREFSAAVVAGCVVMGVIVLAVAAVLNLLGLSPGR